MNKNLFISELLLFAATVALGILSAVRYVNTSLGTLYAKTLPRFGFGDIVIFVIILTLFIWSYKKREVAKIFFNIFLFLIVFSGVVLLLEPLSFSVGVIGVAVIIAVIFSFWRIVIIHNLGMVLGLAGIGSVIGLGLLPIVVIGFMAILSIYDIIAVYRTKHMVGLAKRMVASGAVFGLVIPGRLSNLFSSTDKVEAGGTDNGFIILGSGDIVIPVIFSASVVAHHSIVLGIWTGVCGLIGLVITHMLFINQKQRRPMAALPPIATTMIIGYVIAIFFK